MVVVNVVMITGGQVVAYGIDAAFANVHGGWRWMVGLGALPAAGQAFFLFFLPESRRWPVCVMRGLCAKADMEGRSAYHDPQGQHGGGAWDYDENICVRYTGAS